MSLYEKLVPHTFSPMSSHFMDILMAINTRNCYLYYFYFFFSKMFDGFVIFTLSYEIVY